MLDLVVNNLDWGERNRETLWRGRRKEESECVRLCVCMCVCVDGDFGLKVKCYPQSTFWIDDRSF